MKRAATVLACCALCFGVSVAGAEQPAKSEDPKSKSIRRLMELTGSADMARQLMEAMITSFKQTNKEIPEQFWKEFMTEVDTNEIIELCIPVYAKHFTLEEIQALIDFWGSPVGKKMIATQPVIMQETLALGQQWGQKIGERVARRIKEKGYAPAPRSPSR